MSHFLGTSRDRRPDTVSFDYLTAFSFGPVAVQDPSEGILAYAWRVRYDNNQIWISRSLADSWQTEVLLFEITDGLAEPVEVDIAFTFNGDPVVALERPTGPGGGSEIWIYYYNATILGFELVNFGHGRNPRAIIDQPQDPAVADVQVFYVSDLLGSLAHRQQRDRYLNEYLIATADETVFLQEALLRVDRRLALIVAVRDPFTGRYTLSSIVSVLPGIVTGHEVLDVSHALEILLKTVIFEENAETEGLDTGHELLIDMHLLLIEQDSLESIDVAHTAIVELRSLLITDTAEMEALNASHSTIVVLAEVVIPDVAEMEDLDVSHSSIVVLEPA